MTAAAINVRDFAVAVDRPVLEGTLKAYAVASCVDTKPVIFATLFLETFTLY